MLYPIGIQDFPTIIRGGFVYIDKTELIYRMITTGKTYFLARPRRFGKSLLVSVLETLFKGDKDLFNDLWISNSDYEWKPHQVINLDFSLLANDSFENLERSLQDLMQRIATDYNLADIRKPTAPETLTELIVTLHKQGSVVLLIDEYDKPILDHIEDNHHAEQFRQFFKKFFTNIKALGKYLNFTFITGVTKFSQVSLFSGMNNPEDISFQYPFSHLLGITDDEMSHNFFIDDPEKKLLKHWYNGYRFSGSSQCKPVYNPLSVISYLKSKRLSNYWFATGTPTFAFHLIKKNNYKILDFERGVIVGNSIEMNHDIETIDLVTLLYQTGYLTIQAYDESTGRYRLNFPNEEVRRSFFDHLFLHLSKLQEFETNEILLDLETSLKNEKLNEFFTAINQVLSSIPYEIQVPREAYYHSMIYLLLKMLNYNVQAEVMTAKGRLDLIVHFPKSILIFEFKINSSAEAALAQIKEQRYSEPYISSGKKITLIGVNISTEERKVQNWLQEEPFK